MVVFHAISSVQGTFHIACPTQGGQFNALEELPHFTIVRAE
jgi:hypothetical protein